MFIFLRGDDGVFTFLRGYIWLGWGVLGSIKQVVLINNLFDILAPAYCLR